MFHSLKNRPENFKAGKVSLNYDRWTEITSDRKILNIIKNGYELEFMSDPCKLCSRKEIKFSDQEKTIISDLIMKLRDKGVVKNAKHEQGEIISNIFIRPKSDGTYRLILNLSRLNDHMEKIHFKMDTLKTALNLVKKNCFFAKLDLKDAYYSILITESDRKFLRFMWDGQLMEFTALPNGLSPAPRIYTKVLKPLYSSLRKQGHTNVAYIDDSLLSSDTYRECEENVLDTVMLVDALGLTTHPGKSILVPSQSIEFVGFLINSVDMTVRLTVRKAEELKQLCEVILSKQQVKIRDFAKLIGKMVASEPGMLYAPLYYKSLEIDRDIELKKNHGLFDAYMQLSQNSIDCIHWWIDNVESGYRPITLCKPSKKIETDSSLSGYGGVDLNTGNELSGHWDGDDRGKHINFLEMKAAFLCLQTFCTDTVNEHVQLFLDNTVAIRYLTKMGGRKPLLNALAREIWLWCEKRNIWLTVFHIPGRLNIRADRLSRLSKKLNDDMEWSLCDNIFQKLQDQFGHFLMDLFASAENHKLKSYVSYLPDKNACAVNAYSLQWKRLNYAFPPFSLLGPVIKKVYEDEAELVLVAPIFTSQTWFPRLLQLISAQSYILPKVEDILYLPRRNKTHPLTSMRMGAFRISGNSSQVQDFQKMLPASLWRHGDIPPNNSMGHITKNGCVFVVKNRLIKLIHL